MADARCLQARKKPRRRIAGAKLFAGAWKARQRKAAYLIRRSAAAAHSARMRVRRRVGLVRLHLRGAALDMSAAPSLQNVFRSSWCASTRGQGYTYGPNFWLRNRIKRLLRGGKPGEKNADNASRHRCSRIGCNSSNGARPRGPCVSQGVSRRLLQKRVRVQRTSPLHARGRPPLPSSRNARIRRRR
jgi:hypothetical protein